GIRMRLVVDRYRILDVLAVLTENCVAEKPAQKRQPHSADDRIVPDLRSRVREIAVGIGEKPARNLSTERGEKAHASDIGDIADVLTVSLISIQLRKRRGLIRKN